MSKNVALKNIQASQLTNSCFKQKKKHLLPKLNASKLTTKTPQRQTFACSKLTIEILEKGAKYFQRYCKDNITPMATFMCLYS